MRMAEACAVCSVGLFATKQGVQQTLDSDSVTAYGVLLGVRAARPPERYQCSHTTVPLHPSLAQGGWEQLGVQVLGGVCAAAWTCILSGALFACMRWRGALRVTPETEAAGASCVQHCEASTARALADAARAAGLDILKHGRVAYTEFQLISASSKS